MDETPIVKHTCNAAQPGLPLPFGRKAPEGECPRCDELRAGAPARTLGWVDRKRAREAEEARDNAAARVNRAAGKCRCGRHDALAVCTAGDW